MHVHTPRHRRRFCKCAIELAGVAGGCSIPCLRDLALASIAEPGRQPRNMAMRHWHRKRGVGGVIGFL